jgi:hypothetical protein
MNAPKIDLNRWHGCPAELTGHPVYIAAKSNRGAIWLASLPPPADTIPDDIRGPPIRGVIRLGSRDYQITYFRLIGPHHRAGPGVDIVTRRGNAKSILIFYDFDK